MSLCSPGRRSRDDVATADGVRVTSRARTLAHCAPCLNLYSNGSSSVFSMSLGYLPRSDNLRDFALAVKGGETRYVTWANAHEPAFFLELLKRTYKRRVDPNRAS